MLIDIVFCVILVLAILKGYSRGFLYAVFSVLGLFIGLAAALKLSAVVASYIGSSMHTSVKWLPLISFVLVFAVAVFLVRLLAGLLQRFLQVIMLGWINRLAGILLFAALYSVILSILLFFVAKTNLIPQSVLQSSITYPYLKDIGPIAIAKISTIMPFLKSAFEELKQFFGKMSEHTINS